MITWTPVSYLCTLSKLKVFVCFTCSSCYLELEGELPPWRWMGLPKTQKWVREGGDLELSAQGVIGRVINVRYYYYCYHYCAAIPCPALSLLLWLCFKLGNWGHWTLLASSSICWQQGHRTQQVLVLADSKVTGQSPYSTNTWPSLFTYQCAWLLHSYNNRGW